MHGSGAFGQARVWGFFKGFGDLGLGFKVRCGIARQNPQKKGTAGS